MIYNTIIDICKAYSKGQKYTLNDNIDIQQLFLICKQQQIIPIVVDTINNLDSLGEYKKSFEATNFANFMLSAHQENVVNKLLDFCKKNNYPIAPLKGICTKQYYRETCHRTMGDIDFLYDNANSTAIENFLISQGFKKIQYYKGETLFQKDSINLELHDNLNQWDIDLFDRTDIDNFSLSKDKQFAFIVMHLAKHITTGGAGIRLFLDIALWLKNEQIDIENINFYLNKLNLQQFYNKIQEILQFWFDIQLDCAIIEDRKFIDSIEKFVFEGGIYGKEKDRIGGSLLTQHSSKISAIFSLIFPSKKTMELQYPILQKKPYLLLHYYFVRIIAKLKDKDKNVRVTKSIIYGDKEKLEIEFIKSNFHIS